MEYLLDTHTFIWSMMEPDKLSDEVKNIIEDTSNTIYICTASFWEISIKTFIKKMNFGIVDIRHFPNIAKSYCFNLLSPDDYDCITNFELPMKENHKDPFDRMLIHLAIRKNLIMLSRNEKFKQYEEDGLQLKW